MMTMRIAAVAALALLGACKNPFCSEDRKVHEVEDGIYYDVGMATLNVYRQSGYDCREDGKIRDVYGRDRGTRYVCTKC